jgi:hypothetical protein
LDLTEEKEQREAPWPPPTEVWTGVNSMEEKICLVDSCTTNTIVRKTKHFILLPKEKEIF